MATSNYNRRVCLVPRGRSGSWVLISTLTSIIGCNVSAQCRMHFIFYSRLDLVIRALQRFGGISMVDKDEGIPRLSIRWPWSEKSEK